MHYGSSFFAKEKGKSTLIPKMKGEKIGQRKGLTQIDCLKVNDLYGCLDDLKLVSSNFNCYISINLSILN